ncbi:hypothetical protein D3C87_1512670 [compost metagenome]
MGHTTRLQRMHTLHPTHRAKSLAVERIANRITILLHRDIDIVHHGDLGRGKRDRSQRHTQFFSRRLHQTGVEGRRNR